MKSVINTLQVSMLLTFLGANALAADHAATLDPHLSADVVAVAYVDLTKIDPPAVASWVAELGSLSDEERANLTSDAKVAQGVIDGLKNLGVQRIYWLLRISDIAHQGPTWLVPLEKNANAETIQTTLMFGSAPQQNREAATTTAVPSHWQVDARNTLVGGYTAEQLASQLNAEPAGDLQLGDAWDALGNGSCGLVVMGTADTRRVVREMFPPLPAPLDTIDGELLADKVRWGGVVVSFPPQLSVNIEIESADTKAAVRLGEGFKGGWQMLAKLDGVPQIVGPRELQALLDAFAPQVDGSRVTFAPTEITNNLERLAKLLGPAIKQARVAAQRNTRVNQFKQIALAALNYESAKKTLPTQANYDSDGQPLLSWRVHILPYLDQGALYKQFRLDEPWDSEHNRKLVEKMPSIYADPNPALKELAGAGKTTYVFPIGKGTVHEGPEPKTFKDIIDGTSATIMLVEVAPENVVIWSKPDDWEVDFDDPRKGLRRSDRDWFVAGYWDGHISIIPQSINAELLRGLLTPAGGEIVKSP